MAVDAEIDLDNQRTVVLALTGPPAAGKSTIVGMLRDIGVPCKDTGEAIREQAQEQYNGDDPPEDYIWSIAELTREEHGPAGPTAITEGWIKTQRANGNEVICVSSLREQAEVEWLREHVGSTLVVRVDAPERERAERYVETKLQTDEERESISRERVYELREELYERERREGPYPDHDVTIRNTDSTRMYELMDRLEHLVGVLDS